MKLFRNQEGSTLLLIVITIAVLTVLGTTVLSMSFMNTNMKFTDEVLKTTLYYSESGIDQVYAIVGKYVDDAIEYASDETNDDVDSKSNEMDVILQKVAADTAAVYSDVDEQNRLYTLYDSTFYTSGTMTMSLAEFMSSGLFLKALLYDDITTNGTGSDYYNYATTFLRLETTDGSGHSIEIDVQSSDTGHWTTMRNNHGEHQLIVDTVEIKDFSQVKMNEYYCDYFDSIQGALGAEIIDSDTYVYLDDVDETDGITKATLSYGTIIDFATANSDASLTDDIFTITDVTSTFNYKGQARKTVATDIVIKQPGDIIPLTMGQTKISVENNPLWQYAIITHEDIVFDSSDVTINGAIYSLGNKAASSRNTTDYGGIMLTGTGSDVEITGDVVSESYVQIAQYASSASLDIYESHVYCNSLVVQDGSADGSISVHNGNVYTRDDLELNGENAEIYIDGSYYGFVGSARSFNETSSIVINSDIDGKDGDTSSLEITGNHASIDQDETRDGIFISGVSYVNDDYTPDPYDQDTSNLYQTGESMGIKGNFVAYFFPSNKTGSDFSEDKLYTKARGDSGIELYFAYKNEGTTPVYATTDQLYTSNPTSAQLLADPAFNGYIGPEAKAEFFEELASAPENSIVRNGIINDGSKSGTNRILIDSADYAYTQGAVFGLTGGISTVGTYNTGATRIDNLNYVERVIARDYDYIMNTLRHRTEGDDSSNFFDAGDGVIEVLNGVDASDTNVENATVIHNYSKIDTNNYSFSSSNITADVSGPGPNNGKEVAIVRATADLNQIDNFVIIGSGSALSAADGATIAYDIDQDGSLENCYAINTGSNDVIQGLIITTGRVAFTGTVNYYGSIVAEESILFDNANVLIENKHNDVRKYIAELVLTNPDLKESLNEDTSATVGITMDSFDFIKSVEVETKQNVDSLRQNYNEFIYYQNWRIVE